MEPEKSFQIIEEMIASAKQDLSDNGFYYMLWGYLVFIASLTHFALFSFAEVYWHWIPWPVLMPLGGVLSGIYTYRNQKAARVKTHVETSMAYLWGGFMVALVLALVLLGLHEFPKNDARTTYFVVLLLYGIGTFVSGGILRFRPLILGGLACWACAAVTLYSPFAYQLLLLALAVLIAYIIPGHMLLAKYKQKHV